MHAVLSNELLYAKGDHSSCYLCTLFSKYIVAKTLDIYEIAKVTDQLLQLNRLFRVA